MHFNPLLFLHRDVVHNLKMKEKLSELKNRAQNLQYNDKKELDDIQRKTKMYLEKLFPMKFTYLGEVDSIKFYPSYHVSGMGNGPYQEAWSKGKEELINLLDTRIEEADILSKQTVESKPKIQVVEKVVTVEDHSKIDELNQEIKALRESKNLWQKINWTALITIIISLLGGSFFFGKYVGQVKFEQEKIDIFNQNEDLTNLNDSLKTVVETQNKKIINLIEQIPEKAIETDAPLEITISFSKPLSVFSGNILIKAKDNWDDAILDFTGILGISKTIDGEFDALTIKVSEGDRFFFKDEHSQIWAVNVLDTSIDVDLELVKK